VNGSDQINSKLIRGLKNVCEIVKILTGLKE